MSKTVAFCIVIVYFGVVAALTASAPSFLSDSNEFLKNFVNHEFLNVLGVILAITLASAGQLHLEFNKIEERYNAPSGLKNTRSQVHRAAYWLMSFFLSAVLLVIVKPKLPDIAEIKSIANGIAIGILLCSVLSLISITQTTFRIPPVTKQDPPTGASGNQRPQGTGQKTRP